MTLMDASSNGHGRGKWWGGSASPLDSAERRRLQFRRLALQLHHSSSSGDSNPSALLVSPNASDDCAKAAAGLTAAMAEEFGRPVLLVDAGPQDQALSKMFNCEQDAGLNELLSDPAADLREWAQATSSENVFFLPAGRGQGPLQPTTRQGLEGFLRAAQQTFDFTVVCGGPVLGRSLAAAFAPAAGSVLLLAGENETTVEDLESAQKVLSFCGGRRIGLVLTT